MDLRVIVGVGFCTISSYIRLMLNIVSLLMSMATGDPDIIHIQRRLVIMITEGNIQ